MSQLEEKLAKSLTAETTELIPYLPYLLQDLWELGAGPKDISEMISKHIAVSDKTKILDLACGKGAVSVHLAKTFECFTKGIDIIPEFIDYAKKKAQEYCVDKLCEFSTGDINQAVLVESDYDIVILGAVGDVLGNPAQTIEKLKKTVRQGGFIFIDDAYSRGDADGSYPSREQWLQIFQEANVKFVAEKVVDDEALVEMDRYNQECIVRRANELKAIHPEKAEMFEGYIKSQQEECDELEEDIKGVTWLLRL